MSKRFDSRLSDCAISRVHHLVAGLHVGEPAAKQHVGRAGQDLVREDRQPRRLGTAREKPRSIDDAGAAIENRLRQLRQLRRIELEVGILDRDDRAGGLGEANADRAALAAVLLGVDDAQLRPLRDLVEHLARAVGRSVVDDEDLARRRQIDRDQPLDDVGDGPRFVIDGNDDRNEWVQRFSGSSGSRVEGSCVEECGLHGRGRRAVALDLADRHADVHRLARRASCP